ncbi:hypothetical protein ERX35_000945 [Macrococcus equipercicus]|uniref:DUF4368 domain-containing protein n=1 Tax=Macrococcus equipercicus TaxID=69967 RepID=A0ABQ6RBC1_9STAP|nr:hypothetical protein [Macrococcus equipercicus]KAA1042479.1 hypothetical protein ERX35_000945 [Macrococcus equipercicus]
MLRTKKMTGCRLSDKQISSLNEKIERFKSMTELIEIEKITKHITEVHGATDINVEITYRFIGKYAAAFDDELLN